MKTKFTEGPWGVGNCGKHQPATTVYCDDALGSAVADAFMKYTTTSNEEAQANAHLIASAPDMYKLLDSIAELMNCDDQTIADEMMQKFDDIEFLLKEARGE